MVKSRKFSGLKRNIYSILTAGTLGLGTTYGCSDKNPIEPSNPPQNYLSISPTSGISPLPVRILGRCTDPDGDLRDYKIMSEGDVITRTNPVDTLVTLTQNSSFSSYCDDMKGNISNAGPLYVSVSQPPPPVNNTPQTTLDVNPMSGIAPLESRIKYACTDLDGLQDIEKSYLIVGNDTSKTNSIDSTFIFNQPIQVKGYCEDKKGASSSVGPINIQVSQPDFLDISGQLQDLRNHQGSQGTGAVYSFPDSSLLGKFTTDNNGNFSFHLDSLLHRDSVYLQARQNVGTPDSNFVRTIVLPNRDTTGLIVRAYPYNSVLSDNEISRSEIRAHLQELNSGFEKWNLDSLRGAEIIDVDPLNRGSFTPEVQDTIEKTFKANLSCYTGGRLNDLYIQKDNPLTPEKHYTVGQNGIVSEKNWIFIARDTIMPYGGLANSFDNGDGFVEKTFIRLNQPVPVLISHEEGHSFIAPFGGHAYTLPSPKTIMRAENPYFSSAPGPADCEAGTIIYEDTFRPRESYDRTLGMNFFSQYTTP